MGDAMVDLRSTFGVVGLIAVAVAGCGSAGGVVNERSSAESTMIAPQYTSEQIEAFRSSIYGLLAIIDWSPPTTIDAWAENVHGAFTGTLESVEANVPMPLYEDGHTLRELPNAASAVRYGVVFTVRLDSLGAQAGADLAGADTARFRVDLWTGGSDQTTYAEYLLDRVRDSFPAGARVLVPYVAERGADPMELIPILGTPLIEDLERQRLIAAEPALDSLFADLDAGSVLRHAD
jgi:hypothetical protein